MTEETAIAEEMAAEEETASLITGTADMGPVLAETYKQEAVCGLTQAERDIAVLIEAQKIRLNSARFMAAKALAGAHHIQ